MGASPKFEGVLWSPRTTPAGQAPSGAKGPDRPAEAAAQPPSEGKGGLKK